MFNEFETNPKYNHFSLKIIGWTEMNTFCNVMIMFMIDIQDKIVL